MVLTIFSPALEKKWQTVIQSELRVSSPCRESMERRSSRAPEHSPVPFKASPLSPGGFSLCRSQNANGSKVKMFKGFKNLCVRFVQAWRRCCFSLHSQTRSRSQPEQPPQCLVLLEFGHALAAGWSKPREGNPWSPRDGHKVQWLELPQIITPRSRECSPESQFLIHH